MKLAIVGTGMIVQDFLRILPLLNIEKPAIYGRNQESVLKLATENKIPFYFFDYETMLKADLDTVYIALPNHLHFEFAKQALEAGKNVILEKPITSNYTEFKQLRALAKTKGKILIEAVTVHYLPAYQQLKSSLAQVGKIKIVSLNYSQYSSRYDRFKAGETPAAFDPQKSGGALMDLNVYNLHFAVGLFGKPQSCCYSANIERGIDTSGIMLLNYPTFKAVCIGAKDCAAPNFLSIQGEQGCITIPMPANIMNAFEFSDNNGKTEIFKFEQQHRMLYEFQTFSQIIDKSDIILAEQMLEISEIVCQLTEQARKQQNILFNGE